jgi:hypothetical protein
MVTGVVLVVLATVLRATGSGPGSVSGYEVRVVRDEDRCKRCEAGIDVHACNSDQREVRVVRTLDRGSW